MKSRSVKIAAYGATIVHVAVVPGCSVRTHDVRNLQTDADAVHRGNTVTGRS